MAITLGDINVTLQEQNSTLKEQAQSTKSLNSNISVLVKQIQGQRLDNREREIESRNQSKRSADTSRGRARSTGAKASNGMGIPGAALLAGGLGAIGGLIGSAVSVLGNIPMIGGLLTKLITFGKFFARSAPWMVAAYLIIDNIDSIVKIFDNITKSDLFIRLKETATDLATSVTGYENWSEIFSGFTLKIKEGFEGLVKLTEGDAGGAFDNIAGIGTLMGTLFLAFGKTRKLLFGLVTGAVKLLANVGSKGLKLGAAGAAAAAGAKAVDAGADAAKAAKKLDAVAGGAKPVAQIGSAVKPTVAAGQFNIANLPGMKGGAQGPTSELPKASGGLDRAMKKFPKLFKVLGFLKSVPGLGKALAIAPLLAALAAGAGPDKIAPLAGGIIGGALGWKAGGILGGLLGAAGGPAAIVTGLGGALLGGLLGDKLGTSIAQWATGQKANAMPWGLGWIDDLLNKSSGSSSGGMTNGVSSALGTETSGRTGNGVGPMLSAQRPQVAPAVATLAAENASSSSKQVVVIQEGSSQTVNNVANTSQGLVLPNPTAFDPNDAFLAMR